MKTIPDLRLGFRDAENYRRKENKELFNSIFIRTTTLDELCDAGKYFLVGEKGTGKTAYSVFMSNSEYKNTAATLRYIRETEYQKFVTMKNQKHLDLSDYVNIWKVIIYLLISQQIKDREESWLNFWKFAKLNEVIERFYNNAFSPEIIFAIQFAEEAKIAAELMLQYASSGSELTTSINISESRFQTNLLYIQRKFEEALTSLKLKKNHVLFIDGIDIRPGSIEYSDYHECVKGLANAVWSINNDFFANIKDSFGRLRVVLLVRPDIFDSLGLQNQNSKIRDNSVILNWNTTYAAYRRSPLFELADKMLSYQQEENPNIGEAWDHYFPYNTPNVKSKVHLPSSFVAFLRYSLYRPRDILTMMAIQKENFVYQGRAQQNVFSYQDFEDPDFTRKYSDYLLGEVKDHLSFYHSSKDYEIFVQFFQFLKGKSQFNYEDFVSAFKSFEQFLNKNKFAIPSFCESPDIFLQFLYDLNVISYIVDAQDGHQFFGWCYRERSPSNIAPKVRTHVRYDIHYGLMKALDLGSRFSIKY